MKKTIKILILIFVLIGVWRIVEWDRYQTIQIPSPIEYLPNGDWYYTEKIKKKWTISKDTFFTRRQEIQIASTETHPDGYNFSSWDGIIHFFDDYFEKIGWSRIQAPCDNHIMEFDFIPEGQNGWVAYKQDGSNPYTTEPLVCIVVYPTAPATENEKIYYHVILYSIKPSMFTQWRNSWD